MPSMRKLSPLVAAMQAAFIAHEHWMKVSPDDRRALLALIAKSKGVPKNLTIKERNEVRRIVSALDAKAAVWKLAPVGRKLRPGKR
jgi:hypothetical protein